MHIKYFAIETSESANFWDFPVLRSKFTKFLSFLNQQISFSSNHASIFWVMRHNSSALFELKFYIFSTKGIYQSTNLVKFYMSSLKSENLQLIWKLQFQLKKYMRAISLMTLKSDAKFAKNWLVVSNKTSGI